MGDLLGLVLSYTMLRSGPSDNLASFVTIVNVISRKKVNIIVIEIKGKENKSLISGWRGRFKGGMKVLISNKNGIKISMGLKDKEEAGELGVKVEIYRNRTRIPPRKIKKKMYLNQDSFKYKYIKVASTKAVKEIDKAINNGWLSWINKIVVKVNNIISSVTISKK